MILDRRAAVLLRADRFLTRLCLKDFT